MLNNQDCLHCNPIPVMMHEHQESRIYVQSMEKALQGKDVTGVITNARNYCRLLQGHIFKEDNILYPMAEEALDDIQKEAVLKRYHEADSSSLTAETVKAYETLFAE
jgi:hemerythrin-like domain-containing protein